MQTVDKATHAIFDEGQGFPVPGQLVLCGCDAMRVVSVSPDAFLKADLWLWDRGEGRLACLERYADFEHLHPHDVRRLHRVLVEQVVVS